MATKPTDADAAPARPKSKKMLLIVVAVVVIALVLGAVWIYLVNQRNAALLDEEETQSVASVAEPTGPPTYLPLDNMVVNLADPGGERVAQIGVTLELIDAAAAEKVKAYLPSIRSGILILISQRTAEELLQLQGKEKLAADILADASRHFVPPAPPAAPEGAKKKRAPAVQSPVRGVLFSSFIVQ